MLFKIIAASFFLSSLPVFAQNSDIINICDRGGVGQSIASQLNTTCDKVSWNKMAQLKELEISGSIQGISDNAFSGLINLEKLFIDSNITQVPTKALSSLKKLKSLKFNNTDEGLTIISPNAFLGLSSLEELIFEVETTEIQDGAFNGLTKLEKLTLIVATNSGRNCKFGLNVFQKMDRLKELKLRGDVPSVDVGLFKNLKNLRKLEMNVSGAVPDGLFDELKELNTLLIGITSLTDRALPKVEKLEELEVISCFISPGALQKQKLLRKLKVDMYFCDNGSSFDMNSMTGLSRLEDLNLFLVPVKEIREEHLASLTSLNNFSISSTELSSITAKAFSNSTQLKSLAIGGPVESIDESAFQGLKGLEEITLADTYLTDLPKKLFADLSAVRKATFFRNELTSVPEALKSLTSLEELNMLSNQIQGIDANAFEGLSNLTNISMERNAISYIEDNAFAGLPSLVNLNLSNNYIPSLPSNEQLGIKNPVQIEVRENPMSIVRYASLAVDRENGYFYGWAYDQEFRQDAEKRAIEECNARGGKCSTVLTWSGAGFGVFRTINGEVGTAYGWGLANTQAEADRIARAECLKRSENISCDNFVWAENSASTMAIKVLYDASSEIESFPKVKIGNQVWTTKNLNVTKFRNGDPIAEAKNKSEWDDFVRRRIPAFWRIPDAKQGFLYNRFVARDNRILAPKGWRIPTQNDFDILTQFLGGSKASCKKLRVNTWVENGQVQGTNSSGFSASPIGYFDGTYSTSLIAFEIWASTYGVENGSDFQYHLSLFVPSVHTVENCQAIKTFSMARGMAIRLIKEN